ncbi:MAG: hypothetical protein MJZ33_04520 [Paludibacteraceae bacterium]|nr:hypothetical protein [Paludibacteraceae bacterium]
MRGNRFTESLDPNEKNITFSLIMVLALWYDILFPHDTYMGRLFAEGSSPLYIESPLYTRLFSWLESWSLVGNITALLTLIGIGGLIIRFNGIFAYIKVRTILPAIIFSIIGSILFCHTLTPGIVLSALLMCALYSSFFYVETFNPIHAFNAGFLVATMTLISPTLLLLTIPYFTFLYSTSVLNTRSILASLFGFTIPILYASLYFLIIGEIKVLTDFFTASFQLFTIQYNFSNIETIYLLILGGISILAIGNFIVDNTHDNIKSRKQNTHINSLFLWILALMIVGVPDAKNLSYVLILLCGLMLGRFFSVNSSRISYILFFVFLGISLATFILS